MTIIKKYLLAAAMLLIAGTAAAQQQRLTMSRARMSVLEALTEIRRATAVGIVYNSGILDTGRQVTFPQTEMTLDEALDTILDGTGVVHTLEGRMILLAKAPEAQKATATKAPYVAEGYVPNSPSDFDTPLGNRPVRQEAIATETAPEVRQVAEVVEQPVAAATPAESLWHDADAYSEADDAPQWAIKTNLLYGAATLTPNLSLEVGLGKKTSLELGGSYNPWNLKGSLENNRKLVHMIIKPEFRYWLCERFDGHFFGIHALYSRYNIGTHDVPLLFDKEYRYDGHALGAGLTYGYNLPLAKRWGLEFAIGVGAMWLKYDRYDCATCSRNGTPDSKVYFGPTNASVTIEFLLK